VADRRKVEMIGTIGEGLFELGIDEAEPDAPPRAGYGGDAANTAVMAARLGGARICGRVGDDALGRRLLEFWRLSGVDTDAVSVDEAPTGIYVNERLADGGCRFDYHRRGSAGSRLSSADVTASFLNGLDVLHFTGITLAISTSAAAAARLAARLAHEHGALVSFAVNHRRALHGDVHELAACARAADVVFVSIEEAEVIFGAGGPGEVARALVSGPTEIVVTLGDAGAVAFVNGAETRVAAPAVASVDATGAGDALAGVYLAERVAGASAERALTRAVAAATLSCRSFGAALSYPHAAELEATIPA
jgi:2-dehydro-3-deoxygluconokinase